MCVLFLVFRIESIRIALNYHFRPHESPQYRVANLSEASVTY